MAALSRRLVQAAPASLLCGVVLVGAVLLASAPIGDAYTDGRLAKSLKRELRQRDFDPSEVSRCKPKQEGDAFVCRWRAEAQFEPGVRYECRGRARFVVRERRWKVGRCKDPMVALLPEPGPHPIFGYNDDWRSQFTIENPYPNKLDLLPGAGAEVARQLLSWGWVESLHGTRRWDFYDRFYTKLLARGIRPLWVLWGEPCWARPPGSNCFPWALFGPPHPDNFNALADFAAEAARRYPESAGFEIWNEPNLADAWGGPPDPAIYGQMVQQVAPAVHAANPHMPVITAGLAPVGGSDVKGMDYRSYLREFYRTGAPQLADAIGAHPYPLVPYERDYLGSIRAHMFRYLDVMADFGDATRPIWITEIGVSTVGEGYTTKQQAEALAQMYEMSRRIANAPVVLFHRFSDQPGQTGVKEEGYGVIMSDGQPKPAYCAIAAARGRPC